MKTFMWEDEFIKCARGKKGKLRNVQETVIDVQIIKKGYNQRIAFSGSAFVGWGVFVCVFQWDKETNLSTYMLVKTNPEE